MQGSQSALFLQIHYLFPRQIRRPVIKKTIQHSSAHRLRTYATAATATATLTTTTSGTTTTATVYVRRLRLRRELQLQLIRLPVRVASSVSVRNADLSYGSINNAESIYYDLRSDDISSEFFRYGYNFCRGFLTIYGYSFYRGFLTIYGYNVSLEVLCYDYECFC